MEEFEEIGHTGGKVTFTVSTDESGIRSFQVGVSHSSPRPASLFAIYALPPALPVATIRLGGIGAPTNSPPMPECLPVFIASDSEGWFGHQCPRCRKYWRSRQIPTSCAYCGMKGDAHNFVTEAQARYVAAYIRRLQEALSDDKDGEHIIDMDKVASAVGKEGEKPSFYYSEERQQTHLKCGACGGVSDILGRFGYCSSCGTRNDLAEFEADIEKLRNVLNSGGVASDGVRGAVALFDASAGQFMRQLVQGTRMTPARRNRLTKMRFHDLKVVAEEFRTVFDIDILKGMSADDVTFVGKMFHRRHVYEHGGGEVDEKYLKDSGDTTVRLKQVISETLETAHRLAGLMVKIERNLFEGFHSIYPRDERRIRMETERKQRMQRDS